MAILESLRKVGLQLGPERYTKEGLELYKGGIEEFETAQQHDPIYVA